MVGKNSNNKDIVQLWGLDFKKAGDGLDEEQVVSFVNELISQRNTFPQRQEHLSSLTKLAERTVAEADNMAKQTKAEAVEQANAEAARIIAEAEEQAQQMIEEKRTEVITTTNREVAAIRAEAQQQVELLLEEKTRSIQIELKDTAQSLYRQFLSQLESLQQQIMGLEAEFEHTLSQTTKQFEPIIERRLPSQPLFKIEQEINTLPGIDDGISTQPRDGILAEVLAQNKVANQLDRSEPEKPAPVSVENEEATNNKGEIELGILPPVDVRQIMGIMRYLDGLPQVEATELIPAADRPSIIVFLNETMPLIEILRTLPEVSQVEKTTSGETTSSPDTPQSKRSRIQVTLSQDRAIAEVKEV